MAAATLPPQDHVRSPRSSGPQALSKPRFEQASVSTSATSFPISANRQLIGFIPGGARSTSTDPHFPISAHIVPVIEPPWADSPLQPQKPQRSEPFCESQPPAKKSSKSWKPRL